MAPAGRGRRNEGRPCSPNNCASATIAVFELAAPVADAAGLADAAFFTVARASAVRWSGRRGVAGHAG